MLRAEKNVFIFLGYIGKRLFYPYLVIFTQLMPGVPQANVVARVVVTPDQAKKILGALQNNIGQYEQKFGTIQPIGGPAHGNTLPLTFTGGEA